MPPIKILLFDLDGTLVSTGGAGLRALDRAFFDLFGIPDVMAFLNPCGKTDPAIFREIIQTKLNRDMTQEDFNKASQAYLAFLSEEMRDNKKATSLPGVNRFLSGLESRDDIAVGLGTGNLEAGARIKLEPMGLNGAFAFGGFGSDSEDRPALLQIAHRRGEERAGARVDPNDVYVIGDTALDVSAARGAGYRAVAVASGSTAPGDLEKSKPDFLMRDMTEGEQLLQVIDKREASVPS